MILMGVDFGDARTGIAVCDAGERLASPVCVIHDKSTKGTLRRAAEEAARLGAACIVVGYPKNMNGTVGPRAEKSERFARALGELTGIETRLWDERCTTMAAAVYFNATDTRGKKRKESIDAAAATIILQDYIDYRRRAGGNELKG